MINSLSMKNFKGIQSLELSELAPITLLDGMNNIGKSSVLDALFLLYTATFKQCSMLKKQLYRNRRNNLKSTIYLT